MKRFLLTSLTVLSFLCAPLYLGGCGDEVRPGAETARREITGVKTVEVKGVEVSGYVDVAGTVKAKTISAVSSKVMGAVTSILVQEGERVKRGAPLLTIDDSDIREKVRAAEAGHREALKALEAAKENLKLANLTYERYKKLYEGKALSRQEFDTIETKRNAAELERERMEETVKRAEAFVTETRVYRSYARVTSPVDGVVSEKKTEVGNMANPGMPLMVIEDTSSFILEANADERLSDRIKKGMTVGVTIDSLGRTIEGKVMEAVPSVSPASRTFLVKIALMGDGLKSGQYGKVSFPAVKKTALLLPLSAIDAKGQLTGVYAVDDKGVVTYRLVRTGESYDNNVEILSGLNPGERVIVEGIDKAVDGGLIKPLK
ncbi:MAG: efflux RND transporter periplasmic adaptor subunit [Deltaproteobacteria bacterium]|nr:efflux RND transporter periplasmic adaptor subunit [Deltaproteobacteria bacterium]